MQNTDNRWQGSRATGAHSLLVRIWTDRVTLEDNWAVSYKDKQFYYNPTIALLGIYPYDLKTYVHTKTCMQLFVAALFIITKIWRQSRWPSMDNWMNKLWYTYLVEHCSAVKRNELVSNAGTWINLNHRLLSERRQSEKAAYCRILCTVLVYDILEKAEL